MSDQNPAVAVYSQGGSVIHLHIDGFRTSKPRDPAFPVTVCGVSANTTWPGFPPRVPARPTGRVWVPLREAVALERGEVKPDDPRVVSLKRRRWCPKCVGMALEWVGRADAAIDLLTEGLA